MASFKDGFVVDPFVTVIVLGGATAATSLYLTPLSMLACVVAACAFVLAQSKAADWGLIEGEGRSHPSLAHLPAVYFLYVLGSGGHTTEMCEMVKRQFRPRANTHRRYVTTTGDAHSVALMSSLESLITNAYADGSAGSWDHFQVKRARAVHQPFYTAWYTSIWSAITIVGALCTRPKERARGLAHGRLYKYPHVIVTNGPGTGFVIGLVAHLLKIFYLVPQNRLKLVYVESWAHTQTLSLTGKLFHYTGIASLFCVQHQSLARKLGKHHIDVAVPHTAPVRSVKPERVGSGS